MVEEGIRRLAAYQDRRYAVLYLDRLDPVHALGSAELLRETARHLAVRMSFEDVIRVRAGQDLARSHGRACAPRCAPSRTSRSRSPSISSRASRRSARCCRPAWRGACWPGRERTGRLGKVYFSMHVRTTTVWGFARLRFLASLRWWRPHSFRYVEEQAEIGRWLEQIRAAAPLGLDLAREIAELARLIKGYGDTYKRGLANYHRIAAEVIGPALAGRMAPQGRRRRRGQCAGGGPRRSGRGSACQDVGGDRRVAAVLRHAAE